MPSRSPHPAKAILVMRDIPQTKMAHELQCSPKWVGLCLNGKVHVPERFKTAVAAFLDVSVEDCFRESDSTC